jgi:flagellar basal body-associated protein FliL
VRERSRRVGIVAAGSDQSNKGKLMNLVILIVVLVLLFGGGGGYYWSRGRR